MASGVTIEDPDTTWVEPTAIVEADVVLRPHTHVEGRSVVRSRAAIGPFVRLVDAEVAWIAILPRAGETEMQVASTGPEGDSPLRACRLQRDRAAGALGILPRLFRRLAARSTPLPVPADVTFAG